MTKSISIRLPDELATRIEEGAKAAGNSINAQVILMLEAARSVTPEKIVLSVRIERDVVMNSVFFHVDNEHGLSPILDTDRSVEHWTKYVLLDVGGFDEGETEIKVVADDQYVTVTGGIEIIEAIKMYIL